MSVLSSLSSDASLVFPHLESLRVDWPNNTTQVDTDRILESILLATSMRSRVPGIVPIKSLIIDASNWIVSKDPMRGWEDKFGRYVASVLIYYSD